MISTIAEFVNQVRQLQDVSDAYYLFEDECTTDLQEIIYALSDPESYEPFREAMNKLGFSDY